MLVGAFVLLSPVGAAHAAVTYNDPWLEGDLQQIRVPEALDILARTPEHVIVGDIDSGARLSDPDLAPHLMQMTMPYTCASEYPGGPDYSADPANGDFGCDFIGIGNNDNEGIGTTFPDGEPLDPFGHGTGTAAIIAAVPNNGIGGAGVAPNARVLPVRACYGGGPECYNEPARAGLEYAIAMGATVINASWPPENEAIPFLGPIIHENLDVAFVFAIGGEGQNAEPYDLCKMGVKYPNVICVGLANPDDSSGTNDANEVADVAAPGYAAVPSPNGDRGEFGYTSGATAHVTGAVALLRGIAPELTPSEIRQVLIDTSRQVEGYETADRANGIIDVETAVRAVQELEGLTTPAAGQGAPADVPNPFAPGAGGGGGGGGGTTPVTPITTPAPPAPTPPTGGGRLTLSVSKLPHSVSAGGTLTLHLQVSGGAGTVTATLTHKKATLAKATKRNASGNVNLKLRLGRHAKRGPAKLTLKVGGGAPVVRSISVTKPS